jgi:hypothetical protein
MLTRAIGPGLTGNGCVGGYHSSGTSPLAYRSFFDAEHRLAGFTIEDEHESGFANLSQSRNYPAVFIDVDQARCGRKIVVPQFVMDILEVPLEFAGERIDGNGRIGEQVVARPISSVIVHARAADGHVDDATLLIDSQCERPNVNACAILPAVVAPRVVAEFAGTRMVWKSQSFFPLRASYALVSPRSPLLVSSCGPI